MDAATGLCQGCLRTLDEIAAWGGMDNDGKRTVWAAIDERAAAHPPTFSQREREQDE